MSKRLELKVRALTEKIGSVVSSYESLIADYRVEITLLTDERDALAAQLDEARNAGADNVVPSEEE